MPISAIKEIHDDFIVYAKEVNEERAFPDARDGLKPSQRACLWEMFTKGYTSNKPHVKSAKVDGGVIASWHPHGSEYSTFARMSQDWVNNIPEVDWHGANGSQLGGPQPAASRYTECRLAKASEDGFFSNIKKNVVDFKLNFSEDLEWPTVLPAIFPRLFINGSQGIGYTIAQEWELGNLREFTEKVRSYLKTKKVNCNDIYPDYPTGGIIINKKDIHTIYETGKGSVILRAKTEIEDNIIKITELPYQVYAEPLIQEIKDLVNSEKIIGIEDIYNKSGDTGLLIEIECSEDPDYILNRLFKLTDLQCTFSANQMALVNGIPEMLTLEDYIKVYLNHNLECIKREYEFDLKKATDRKEIVDGLIKAIQSIDSIIVEIKKSKSSDDAKNNLVKKFGFTENQAKAIVDMRLGKLAHLEGVELNKEAKELDKTINDCNKILASDKLREKELIKRLDDFTNKYGLNRRTQVTDIDTKEEKAQVTKVIKPKEEYMIILSDDNMIKRIKLSSYSNRGNRNNMVKTIKTLKVSAGSKIVLISNLGKMYKLPVNKIAFGMMGSSGSYLPELLNLKPSLVVGGGVGFIEGEKIINIFSTETDKDFMVFITKNGLIKKMNHCLGLSKSTGAVVMKLDSQDEVISVDLYNDSDKIELKTSKRDLTLKVNDLKAKGRGAGGVKIKLKKEECIL